jgi:hypothetical protein
MSDPYRADSVDLVRGLSDLRYVADVWGQDGADEGAVALTS